MDFGLLPPEVNSGLMYTGPGSGPMLAAAAGWNSVASELESAAGGYWSAVSDLTGMSWFGPSSMMMTAAATPYVAWLHYSAAAAGRAAAQAYSAVAAYETAHAMTVPPPAILANRTLKMALVATNFFGQNTPAIAATEAQYMGMWAQDAAAMYGYAAASESATTLTSFSEPPQTTNSDGTAAQARSVAQEAGNAVGARTQAVVQQLANAAPPKQIFGPGTYGEGNYFVAAGGTIDIAQGGELIIGNGASLILDKGAVLTIGPNSTFTVLGPGTFVTLEPGAMVTLGTGSEAAFGTASQAVMVDIGATSSLAVGDGAQVILTTGTMSVTNSAVTVTGTLGVPAGTTTSSTIVIDGSTVTTTGAAQATGVAAVPPGTVVVPPPPPPPTAVAGPATAAVPTPGASLISSPGLAGTSAIQPQLNADLLLDWANAVPGGELVAGLAG